MLYTFLLLGGGAAAEGGEKSALGSFLPLIFIMVIFYFFMIRPQMRKQKEIKKHRESLKIGDKVITIGGIHGKIVDMDETTVVLEVNDKTKIKFEKTAISAESTANLKAQDAKAEPAKVIERTEDAK